MGDNERDNERDNQRGNPVFGILKLFLRLFWFAGKIGVRTLRMVFFRKKSKDPDRLEDGKRGARD